MSIPKNHHYVSQCHIKNFFNVEDERIYLFDKQLNNFFSKPTTKTVFSEDLSNSRVVNGMIDHTSLETDLKKYEDYFQLHFEAVKKYAEESKSNYSSNYTSAFLELIKYGIASETRHPIIKKYMDDQIDEALFGRILPYAAPELKAELEKQQEIRSMTSYSNSIDYSEFAEEVLKRMGDLCVIVYVIKTDDYFILPDRYSLVIREKINEYFNPDVKEIAFVATPLSSKIFFVASSKKFLNGRNTAVEITENNRHVVYDINKDLYEWALKQVACEDRMYLADLVSRIQLDKR
ncbi:DUF4238 domain-containing protein [Spirosoma lituiforme]